MMLVMNAPFLPSPQQATYFTWITDGTGSCVLEAVAGAGKTSTLIYGLTLMSGTVFFGAYNKKIAEEIEARATKRPGLFISTMHSAGFRAWRRAASKVQVDNDKCRNIFRLAALKYPEYAGFEGPVLQLVSLAKQAAVGISKPAAERSTWQALIDHFDIECMDEATDTDNTDLIIRLARKTLERSIERDMEVVDFDDMIYAPLVHNVRMFEHDWVLIDEAQDTNESRRLLALRMLKRGGRLVAVGDRHQAIYGFTGADSDSLDLIARAVNAKQLPLTTTFRCPKSVVTFAQQWVSHIQAAETAPEGVVSHAVSADLATVAVPGDVILCRFNAPLIKYVYKFIAAGVPAKVEGREIGNGLKQLARRWKAKTLAEMVDKLDVFVERETAKFRAKEQESKAAAVEDKVNCLKVIIDRVFKLDPTCKDPVGRVCQEIDSIFTEDGNQKVVLFSSIHKSKGREWHKVVWLQTGPSGWARMAWEQEQEANLCYVAATRAKHELVLVDISADGKE
jgi:DNA helicase-2/ATP-dependent DNA helicase PcrA